MLFEDEKEYFSYFFGLLFDLLLCILEDGFLFCFVRNIYKLNNYWYIFGDLCLGINLKVIKEINFGNNCFCYVNGF